MAKAQPRYRKIPSEVSPCGGASIEGSDKAIICLVRVCQYIARYVATLESLPSVDISKDSLIWARWASIADCSWGKCRQRMITSWLYDVGTLALLSWKSHAEASVARLCHCSGYVWLATWLCKRLELFEVERFGLADLDIRWGSWRGVVRLGMMYCVYIFCRVTTLALLDGIFSRISMLVIMCANIRCVEKNAKCLKISAKCFVNSDFLCIFARFLCALRSRTRVRP